MNNGKVEVVGEVDYNSGLWMVHPGAIYIHDGETYRVDELDLTNCLAFLLRSDEDYVTEPVSQPKSIFSLLKTHQIIGCTSAVLK